MKSLCLRKFYVFCFFFCPLFITCGLFPVLTFAQTTLNYQLNQQVSGNCAGSPVELSVNTSVRLTTSDVSEINVNSAISGGNVGNDGGNPISQRGVCWSTTPNPTTASSNSSNGTGLGSFSSNLTGLSPNTLYYVRAYAINSAGTFYGNQVSFTTAAVGSITALNCASATNTGTITQGTAAAGVSSSIPYTGGNGGTHNGQMVVSTGVTGLTATLAAGTFASGAGSLTYTIAGTPSTSGTASFALSIGGQTCTLTRTVNGGANTAHSCGATNLHNPSKTYGSMTDQQGNVYKTIVIGAQEWMAENLKTNLYRNGETIPNIVDNNQWAGLTTGAWCNYNNDSLYDCPYGKLYNWYSATDPRDLCPIGWHLPSDTEWTTLITYIDPQAFTSNANAPQSLVAGGKMKSVGSQYWEAPNSDATNEIGFSGISGGARVGGYFYYFETDSYYWSSTTGSSTSLAWNRELFSSASVIRREAVEKSHGHFVRCIKDVSAMQGSVITLDCGIAIESGTLMQGSVADGVSSSVPYTGGNGGTHDGQTVVSTGVTGLTATLTAGTFASGAGILTYNITGTPASNGIASFVLNIGGQSCTLTRTVNLPVGTITALTCASATNSGTLTSGTAASGVSSVVPYTGGNGGTHNGQTVTSTGVPGLTATLAAGTFSSGAGNLNYNITGTPFSSGIASFAINIGGQTCTLIRTVNSIVQTGITQHTCGTANVHNATKPYGTMTDQEGNAYRTVVIGTQEWMAENLKTATYANGDPIQNFTDNSQWFTLTTPSWRYYNNDSQYNCPYGKLYNWYTVVDPRNLCPTGWHIPSYGEWETLVNFLGGQAVAGAAMKSTGVTSNNTGLWSSPNSGATNSSGFSGIPGSNYVNYGLSWGIGGGGAWWTSTLNSSESPWGYYLMYERSTADLYFGASTRAAFGVRCIKDASTSEGVINSLDCGASINCGILTAGTQASGVISNIPYSGGNGGRHNGQIVASSGVLGLTATLGQGAFANGSGNLNYVITGTPTTSGIAIFNINIGGKTCSLSLPVSPNISATAHSCGTVFVHNPLKSYGTMTDQEGNVYKTINIGSQEWMAENLKTTTYRNGQPIANVTNNSQWFSTNTGSWRYFNNNSAYNCPYGKLYNWYAVVDSRNLCPTGWHAPSYNEWFTMINFLGGQSIAGGSMKSAGISSLNTGLWSDPNAGASNSSGFSGIPGGNLVNFGLGWGIGGGSGWWTSTLNAPNNPWAFYLMNDRQGASVYFGAISNSGFYVRCVRD
jgi:uncharacterized protein (TIGR02145 family)